MMPAAVSVPGEPNGAPVNDSIAAPMDAWPPGAGVGSMPAYVHPLPAAAFMVAASTARSMNGERVGEGCAGGARIVLAREDIHHHIRRFESDRKAARSAAGVPRARIEGPVWLQHRDGGEVEVPLPVRTPLAHGLDDARGLPHRVPVDAVVARHDDVRVEAVAGL